MVAIHSAPPPITQPLLIVLKEVDAVKFENATAKGGKIVVCAAYSTFAQAAPPVAYSIVLLNQPVKPSFPRTLDSHSVFADIDTLAPARPTALTRGPTVR